jgi:hypothetical protein
LFSPPPGYDDEMILADGVPIQPVSDAEVERLDLTSSGIIATFDDSYSEFVPDERF